MMSHATKRRAILGCCLLCMASVPSAQQLPVIKDVTVQATITRSSVGYFVYSLKVTNSQLSAASVAALDIDVSKPVGSVSLTRDGLTNGPGFLEIASSAVLQKAESVPMVPVGVRSPGAWHAGLSVFGKLGWFSEDDSTSIRPGQFIGGFEITSPGPPGIRSFVAKPYLDDDALPIDPPTSDEDITRYLKDLAVLEDKVTVKGVTIGPTAPPADFKPIDFLRTIISYKEQALQLGWIKDRGIGMSLDARLYAAQAALKRGEDREAVKILRSLLREIDERGDNERNDKQLSPEAVALLKFNTEYLIDLIEHVPSPPPDRDRDDKDRDRGNDTHGRGDPDQK